MTSTYVTLPPERVLYIQKIGGYNIICPEAINEMKGFLTSINKLTGAKVYSISYDDPRENPLKCRFDFCAIVSDIEPQREIQEKPLDGGRFALFRHQGPDDELEPFIARIFTQ